MPKQKMTPALRQLKQAGIDYEAFTYRYQESGGASHAADELGVDSHQMIKTIVMNSDSGEHFFVLMHGDQEISTKALARYRGDKTVSPADPRKVLSLTGYQVGGTSPFGSRAALKVYAQQSIFSFDQLYINGGTRGLIVRISAHALKSLLSPELVDVAIDRTQ